ncbi:helix-turn-helix domain-containing protein [Burkholderia thailandensis]|uniref:helix-turn-helix domain-containing protein n=1 Tax=Burkholderia thailandensis TaxID=57975 RepID=UPI0039C711A8
MKFTYVNFIDSIRTLKIFAPWEVIVAVNKKLSLETKWGSQVIEHGWVAVPVALIFLQGTLKISSNAMNVLLNLLAHWWGDESPYPSQVAIAARMGVSKRTVQRSVQELIDAGLLTKLPTQVHNPKFRGRNLYDLSPLTKRLRELAPTLILRKKDSAADVVAGSPLSEPF